MPGADQVNRHLSGEDILRAVFDAVESALRVQLAAGVTLEAGDIQIGAVELKNAITDARAAIGDPDDLTIESVALAVADKRALVQLALLVAALGAPTGAAVVSDADGTAQQYLRGLIKVIGAIDGAAVITDANGTAQQYLRGLVKLEAARVGAGTAAAAERVTLASDDPAVALLKSSTAGGQGSLAVTTAETPLQLSGSSVPCRRVFLSARKTNTNQVAWGFSNTVRATAATPVGMTLQAGDSVVIEVSDLNKIWVDVITNGEKVSFTYTTD